MTKPFERRHDIPIGPDLWINYVDVDGRQSEAVDLDNWLEPMQPFWDALESSCVAECCGIDAFSLFPADIQIAAEVMDKKELADLLSALISFIEESKSTIFVSRRLNQYFDRSVALQLFKHVANHAAEEWQPP